MRCQAERDVWQCWLDHGHHGRHVAYSDPGAPAIRWVNSHRFLRRKAHQ